MDTPENPPTEPQAASKILGIWLKWRLSLVGFFGWYLIEGMFWLLTKADPEGEGILTNICMFPVTVLALIGFAVYKPTRKIALGILAALVVNLVISLILGLTNNASCFIPFFIK